MIMQIIDKKEIKIVATGDKTKTYADFCKELKPEDPAYCVVDVPYVTKAGAENEKVVFIYW